MQLLESLAREEKGNRTKILWMYWGETLDEPVEAFKRRLEEAKLSERLLTDSVEDAGSFLFEFLCALIGEYPSTRRPYPAPPLRPTVRQLSRPKSGQVSESSNQRKGPPAERIRVFMQQELWDQPRSDPHGPLRGGADCSVEMSRFCSALQAYQYHTIWIDCEDHHTTEGVVADILDQINVLDPSFTPLLLQTSEPRPAQPRAANSTSQLHRSQHLRAVDASASAATRPLHPLHRFTGGIRPPSDCAPWRPFARGPKVAR